MSRPVSARRFLAALPAVVLAGALAAPAGAATMPSGYVQVTSTPSPLAAGSYVLPAVATCPHGTVIWGGGVTYFGGTPPFGANIAGAFPSGQTTWVGQMNNSSTLGGQIEASVVCAAKPAGYTQVVKKGTAANGTEALLNASCPTGKVVLGGGVSTTADSPGSWVTDMGPASTTKFRTVISNTTGVSENFAVIAICAARPSGYSIVTSSTSVTAPSIAYGGARCPAKTVVISGGELHSTPVPEIAYGGSGTEGFTNEWQAEVESDVSGIVPLNWKAVCAS